MLSGAGAYLAVCDHCSLLLSSSAPQKRLERLRRSATFARRTCCEEEPCVLASCSPTRSATSCRCVQCSRQLAVWQCLIALDVPLGKRNLSRQCSSLSTVGTSTSASMSPCVMHAWAWARPRSCSQSWPSTSTNASAVVARTSGLLLLDGFLS